jgi:glycosyltransferase involved in cell wall biosynthesis
MQVSVSAVIPTFNRARSIGAAVESVLAQTVVPSEIVVVDDGSTDDTADRLRSYGEKIRYVYQQNAGVSAARNRGIRAANGEFIAFLDSDDVWHPRKLEWQLGVLREQPDLVLLATDLFDWPAAAYPELHGLVPDSLTLIPWSQVAFRTYITTSSAIIRSAALARVGGFDEELRCAEDRDLWMRLGEVGNIGVLQMPLTGYREDPQSLSKSVDTLVDAGWKLLKKMDARRAWQGQALLRRKAYSYYYFLNSYEHSARGDQRTALHELLFSLAWYPFPYRRHDVRQPWARPKSLAVYLLRRLGLKAAVHEARSGVGLREPSPLTSRPMSPEA